jgi:hypothetical protein
VDEVCKSRRERERERERESERETLAEGDFCKISSAMRNPFRERGEIFGERRERYSERGG